MSHTSPNGPLFAGIDVHGINICGGYMPIPRVNIILALEESDMKKLEIIEERIRLEGKKRFTRTEILRMLIRKAYTE